MKKHQAGFSLVEALLAIIALTLIGFAGWYVWNSNQEDANDRNSTSGQSKAAKQAAADPTKDWVSFKSTTGQFSLRYPNDWVTAPNAEICEDDSFLLLGPTEETVGLCASDASSQVSLSSAATSETQIPALTAEYYDDMDTQAVTVDGVRGQRQSGTYVSQEEGIAPPVGTKEVNYSFTNNNRVYRASYSERPGSPNVLKEFDLIVTKTLKFE